MLGVRYHSIRETRAELLEDRNEKLTNQTPNELRSIVSVSHGNCFEKCLAREKLSMLLVEIF